MQLGHVNLAPEASNTVSSQKNSFDHRDVSGQVQLASITSHAERLGRGGQTVQRTAEASPAGGSDLLHRNAGVPEPNPTQNLRV